MCALTICRKAKATLTPIGLNHGDTLVFSLAGGAEWRMELVGTQAEVIKSGSCGYYDGGHEAGEVLAYAFSCEVKINGKAQVLRREVGTQKSFYSPWLVDGVRIWFDAAACAFKDCGGPIAEKDWKIGYLCQPAQHARFAVQEASLPICPEPLHPWFPNDSGRIDIKDCYNGEDCWMGPYNGGAAHCGLDLNMKAGTILTAPISFDDQYYFHSLAAGYGNNRWRGIRRWADGSEWQLQTHHLIGLLVPERMPLQQGVAYASTAGVAVGAHEHTHFMFRIIEQGGEYLLDPWILIGEIFEQVRAKKG